ncbi:hypothetical protein NDU88_002317 [Pleurodeles waltl]|uniref:Uncharacterized protein n=1 Tax=Pleurodeles waltl TaxID=8319 RepID=A0AAV7RFF5_PLEWA|nr:hypothetical protein NDU88_002317 [Pleurodeles waltl]
MRAACEGSSPCRPCVSREAPPGRVSQDSPPSDHRSHCRQRPRAGPVFQRPTDPTAGSPSAPLRPLGRRQTHFNDGGAGSIAGPDPQAQGPQLPEPSRTHDSSAALFAAPSRLWLHRDEIRPVVAGAHLCSVPGPLSLTPSGERALLCLPLSPLRFLSDPTFGLTRFPRGHAGNSNF